MKYLMGDTENACQNRYQLWATEVGAMLLFFAVSCFYSNPVMPWTLVVFFMAAFNILAWRDRRRWKFHQALNRLTRTTNYGEYEVVINIFGKSSVTMTKI